MNLEKFIQANNYDVHRSHNATPQEYFDKIVTLFNKHNVTNEQLNDSQWEVLQEIIDIKKIIYEKLQPLKDELKFDLSLVGGSLRDIISGKTELINDYDIVLSLGYVDKEKIKQLTHFAKKLNILVDLNDTAYKEMKDFRINAQKEQVVIKGYTWEDYHEKSLLENLEANYYLSKIVKHLMSEVHGVKHFEARNVREEYANYHITSIHQFLAKNNKKVDLIVSDYSEMNFLSTFDIELCKLYVDLNKIQKKEDLIENIIQTGSMIRDLEDKTLSINVIKFSEENQEYFFNKHLLKLMDKYPDYKVNIYSSKPISELTNEEKQRWVYGQHLKMNFNYPEKGNVVKKLKI